MEQWVPEYYDAFQCMAGSCPKSCCTGWEICLDSGTAAFYRTVPGELGVCLREKMKQDADGDLCFSMDGDRCPFLNRENLCEIHLQLDEEHTSQTCQTHPRFTEEYGPFCETHLSASCPAAAALLLGDEGALTYQRRECGGEPEPGDAWLEPLRSFRETLLKLLYNRAIPVSERLCRVLALAERAQEALNREALEELYAIFAENIEMPNGPEPEELLFPAAWFQLEQLEILEKDWLPLLEQCRQSPGAVHCSDQAAERLMTYFLYRYLLKAVNDGDLLGKIQLSLFSVMVIRRLTAWETLCPAVYRYCREIEHDEENLAALQEAFAWETAFQPAAFYQELKMW